MRRSGALAPDLDPAAEARPLKQRRRGPNPSRLGGLASGATMTSEFRRVNDGFAQNAALFSVLSALRPGAAPARRTMPRAMPGEGC